MRRQVSIALAALVFAPFATARGGSAVGDGVFAPLISDGSLDRSRTHAFPGKTAPQNSPLRIEKIDHSGTAWRPTESDTPTDARYVLAFNEQTAVGTVVLNGHHSVSYLKDGGKPEPNDASQWTVVEYPGREGDNLRAVPLPPNVRTKAILLVDRMRPNHAGRFGSELHMVVPFATRFVNVAPLGECFVSSAPGLESGFRPDPKSNQPEALIDSVHGPDWRCANRDDPLSEAKPEWVVLTWPRERALRGCAVFIGNGGFGRIKVQRFTGRGDPQDAPDGEWETVKEMSASRPWRAQVYEAYCDFGREVTTKALRLLAVQGLQKEQAAGGEGANPKAIQISEVMAFENLGAAPAPERLVKEQKPDGVVPIHFRMPEAGKATIQILDERGNVVKNLASGREFEAGRNTVWWDLSTVEDYWTPFDQPKQQGITVPAHWRAMTTPGTYTWRGLWHPGLSLSYKYSYYPLKKHGKAWITADSKGGWLSDHEPPRTLVRTGDTMWVGTFCEAGHALLEADLDMEKLWGSNRIWLACPRIMTADGEYVYFIAQGGWVGKNIVIIQIDKKNKSSRRIMRHGFEDEKDRGNEQSANLSDLAGAWDISGFAVRGSTAYVADRARGALLVLDLSSNLSGPWRGFGWDAVGTTFDSEKMTVVKTVPLPEPGRIRFYDENTLAAVSGKSVVLIDTTTYETTPVLTRLVNPMGLAVDEDKNIYVGEMEPEHVVKVYSRTGRLLRVIGERGKHRIGRFNSNNLESPTGVEVDAQGNVWVCEHNEHLKRTSVWDNNGRCINQVLGPTQYGGGGCIDPDDANRFFYQGKEFRRNPRTGDIRMTHIAWRGDDDTHDLFYEAAGHNFGGAAPSYAFRNDGKLYFTSWQGWAAGNRTTLFVYDRDRIRPVAAVGAPPAWLYKRLERGEPDPRFGRVVHTRIDKQVDFSWGGSPTPSVKADGFAARWSGTVEAPREGEYLFRTTSDDGVRLFVDEKPIIANWTDHGSTEDTGAIRLAAGLHDLRLEFYENAGGARIRLEWEGPEIPRQVIPSSALRASKGAGAEEGLTARFYYGGHPDSVFAWTDENDDGRAQPDEVQMGPLTLNGQGWDKIGSTWNFLMNDTFQVAASDGAYGASGVAFFRVKSTNRRGYPVYELPTELKHIPDLQHAADGVMTDLEGNAIVLDNYVYSMKPDGTVNWRYKNRWPGLHAGHHTTSQGDDPGVLIATTRFWGSAYVNKSLGEVISFNSNLGATYLMTADGLYIDQVFKDCRRGLSWLMDTSPSDEVMNQLSVGDEHFGGTFQRVKDEDGKPHFRYVVGQPHCSVVELAGLDDVKRLAGGSVRVEAEHLTQAENMRLARAQREAEPKVYTVRRAQGVTVDADAREWPQDNIDGFSLAYDAANLYVLFRGKDERAVFQNAANEDAFLEAFKTGDIVDVKLQTNPSADAKRSSPAEGDIRLSFSMVGGKPTAILYDFVVPGVSKNARNPFSSPWRTIYIDRVSVLSDARVAVNRAGDSYTLEAAVPLKSIHLDPARAKKVRGDVGRVLSDQTGTRAVGRVYWCNKSTNIVSDVPSEAAIHPNLWGTFVFE